MPSAWLVSLAGGYRWSGLVRCVGVIVMLEAKTLLPNRYQIWGVMT